MTGCWTSGLNRPTSSTLRSTYRCCVAPPSGSPSFPANLWRTHSPDRGLFHLRANVASTGAWSESRRRRPPGSTSSRSSAGRRRGFSTTSSPRASRWSIAFGPVGSPSPKRSRSSTNAAGLRAGRRLRSPPKTSGSSTRPLDRVAGRPHHLLGGQLRQPGGRVQVGEADGALLGQLDARPVHPPPLGLAGERKAAVLHDPARVAHEHLVRAALPGGDQVRIHVRRQPLRRRQDVARGEHAHAVRGEARAELPEPQRRRLLEQRHVPLVPGQPPGELVEERPVHLHVRLVALGYPKEPGAQREERRVGRVVAAVVEIPAEDSHWRSTS